MFPIFIILKTHLIHTFEKYNKPISKELEYKLYSIYKPHVDKLYSIIGRKIESWEKYYHSISYFNLKFLNNSSLIIFLSFNILNTL